MIDLAIIGGGPAGTTAAIEAARRGLSVAIWERDRFPRDKVCGEFLSAESLPFLASVIPATLERGAAIRRSEFISPRGRVRGFVLPLPGRGLSRRVLDEALWRAASAVGAGTREGEPVRRLRKLDSRVRQALDRTVYVQGSGWELQSDAGNTLSARGLIIACGRWWTLEGFPSPAREGRSSGVGAWVGVKAHFSGVAPRDAVEMYYFPGGYCGLAPIEDGMYNACCLVHRRLARDTGAVGCRDFAAWMKTVARHNALDARLQGANQVSGTMTIAPLGPGRQRAEHDGALLVGDAAGFLDPFTGDGISIALNSGRLAAEEWARCRSGEVAERLSNPSADGGGYGLRIGRAVRRSYMVAGLLRALVGAPAGVQAAAAAALPWLGSRLVAETRWRF